MLLAHHGQDGSRHTDLTGEVGVQLAGDLVVGEVFDGAVESVAGVVEEGVDASEAGQAGLDGGFDGGGIGDIALGELDEVGIDPGEVGAVAVGVAHCGDDGMPAQSQLFGGGEAEASGCAGDQRDLSF